MKIQDVSATTPAAELPKGPKAAEAFEAYLISFLSKEMRKAVPDGPLSTGAVGMFADFFDQEIGKRVAAGRGIGMRDDLENALSRRAAKELGGAPHPEPIRHPPVPIRRTVEIAHTHEDHHARVTSGFGERKDPFNGSIRKHDGIDLALAAGTPVHAERDGVVRFAGDRGGYGNVVIIDHGDGLETRYAHCATLTVQAGDKVPEGAVVGTVGSTGRSTGPHLHFEVRQNGLPTNPTNFVKENR